MWGYDGVFEVIQYGLHYYFYLGWTPVFNILLSEAFDVDLIGVFDFAFSLQKISEIGGEQLCHFFSLLCFFLDYLFVLLNLTGLKT